jgi:hypothetical protein
MGQEIKCVIEYRNREEEGTALLETSEILFRGSIRLKIPFSVITELDAQDGKLSVAFPEGPAVFRLGKAAEKWAEKIRNPPTLLDKLGVKSGSRVGLSGKFENTFEAELKARGAVTARKELDLLFFVAESNEQLTKIDSLVELLTPAGALWIVYPKGVKSITEAEVMKAGKAAGLVDTKVASFSSTHTALKMVIPVSKRTLP